MTFRLIISNLFNHVSSAFYLTILTFYLMFMTFEPVMLTFLSHNFYFFPHDHDLSWAFFFLNQGSVFSSYIFFTSGKWPSILRALAREQTNEVAGRRARSSQLTHTISHVHFPGMQLEIQKNHGSPEEKQIAGFITCDGRARGVCICVKAPLPQVAPLPVPLYSAATASDTLNQSPPPTPSIRPRTHIGAPVNLMPPGHI